MLRRETADPDNCSGDEDQNCIEPKHSRFPARKMQGHTRQLQEYHACRGESRKPWHIRNAAGK
ncbi:hypothetical protein RvVAR0630_pl04960 (plasmid) [Agrobacterium vitis]|nr:hypothetical protein RvVAR0630_pl04960 [Agrobacterium vitis]